MPTPIFAMMPCNMGIFTLRLRSSAPREVPSTHVSATQKAVPVIALFVILVVVESLDAQYSAQVADVAQPYSARRSAHDTIGGGGDERATVDPPQRSAGVLTPPALRPPQEPPRYM